VKYLTEPPDFSGFGDPAKGKVAAEGMFQNGADVVYHAAGGSGGGVFEAAKAAGGLAIGVDSDQYLTADASVKDVIITSMLKRVDVAVYEAIKASVEGSPLTGVQTFDLSKDGVGYSDSNPEVSAFTAKADELKAQIIDGTITVPDSTS
jgi:basic membrane protein A